MLAHIRTAMKLSLVVGVVVGGAMVWNAYSRLEYDRQKAKATREVFETWKVAHAAKATGDRVEIAATDAEFREALKTSDEFRR